METAGSRIRALRLQRGWSLQQLADRVGASKPQIDKLERGTRTATDHWIQRLAAAFEVPVDEIARGAKAQERAGYDEPPAPLPVSKAARSVDTVAPTVSMIVSKSPDSVPVLGYGLYDARSGLVAGALHTGGDSAEQAWRPTPLRGVATAYAVRMPDDSMMPKYRAGQLLFVHPQRPPGIGDPVVLRLQGARFVVGLLQTGDGGPAVRTLNPAATLRFARHEVVAIERVVVAEEA